jgi:AraC family transcriptional regulator
MSNFCQATAVGFIHAWSSPAGGPQQLSISTTDRYLARFRRVLEYIDGHLEETLDVERLGDVAGLSKYHFHRQFAAVFGIGVFSYVQLTRLRKSSYLLAFRNEQVMQVALASGFEGPEAFARAFKKSTGQTPSDFRADPQWDHWHSRYEQLNEVRRSHMQPMHRMNEVKIVDFQSTKVAALEYRGDLRQIGGAIRRFIAWRRQNGLPPSVSATFNVVYHHPRDDEDGGDCHYDLCASITRDIPENSQGVVGKVLPAGRCATLTHTGAEATLGQSVSFLYREWLPPSGEEPRDFPLFFKRMKFFPDAGEHEAVTEIYLPIR